jgi:hypothetical protein
MKKTLLTITLFITSLSLFGQSEILQNRIVDTFSIIRSDWQHIKMIQREQMRIDYADGVKDSFLNIDEDMLRSKAVSKAIFNDANNSLYYILNNFKDAGIKSDMLRTLTLQLKTFNTKIDQGKLDANYIKRTQEITYALLRAIKGNRAEKYINENASPELYDLAPMLHAYPALEQQLLVATAEHYPEILLPQLKEITPASLADKVVAKASRKEPKLILNFATSTAQERDIVRRNKDSYVMNLVKIADEAKTPLKAILFLNEYDKGNYSLAKINTITEDKRQYYQALVSLINKDEYKDKIKMFDKELNQESKYYVQLMNELHNAGDATRFKCINSFNAAECYYIMVYGDDEFYTSSYLGVFNRLVRRMQPKNGYEFLEEMNFTKFRTFIRLNGNYNTLSQFLKSMKSDEQQKLMTSFVDRLENTGEKSLEGAIDVANTFSSIKDDSLKNLVIEEVQRNRSRCNLAENKYGYRIYHILNTMFTGTPEEISTELNIPPISSVTHKSLENDSGVIVHQIFFPGDGDGKGVFNSFIGKHSNGNWSIIQKEKWVEISSRKGSKIVKYANKPFDEPQDEFAQNELQEYLDANNIKPSIVIQRGHSYHVQNTLDHLNTNHKIVILGACGGFNHLETIMKKSPDAQIISSKQIGSGSINWPILTYLDTELAKGNDIDWVNMWSILGKRLNGNELFDDYVPPHKNLGSLFLKAYYRAELED